MNVFMDDNVDVDECHSSIWMDEMNGCMVQYMDEIHSFSMNPMGIGIEIFTLTSIRGFQ
jgi:hypothetical protein